MKVLQFSIVVLIMAVKYELPLKDCAIFQVEGSERLVAVGRQDIEEIYSKLNAYNTFRLIPSTFKIEVMPITDPNAEEKVFLKVQEKYFELMNKLRPVAIANDSSFF